MKVLVVDDNQDQANVIQGVLETEKEPPKVREFQGTPGG
jgi:CheY-like chemotaxis protein